MLLLAVAVPALLTYRSYHVYFERLADEQRQVREVSDLHLATVEALAAAIDAKDNAFTQHVRRVERLAGRLAQALGMSESEVRGVKTAALLHDIGKLAVPEYILSKPGPLTAEEFARVQAHPRVGAEIISNVPFPYPVVPLVRSHHERWDGSGYPRRPGRRGHPARRAGHQRRRLLRRPHRAIALSPRRAGSGRDRHAAGRGRPRARPARRRRLHRDDAGADRRRRARGGAARASGPGTGATAMGSANRTLPPPRAGEPRHVFDDIARAHRELYVLYEIAQSMGRSLGVADTFTLVASRLGALVPYSACALFLKVEGANSVRCAEASGVDAAMLRELLLPLGAGNVGWAVRERQALLNGEAGLDFVIGEVAGESRLRAALVTPLVFNDECIGALAVYHAEIDAFKPEHQRFLERVGEQAAAVIYHSMLFERTREDSLSDLVTGLPNARFLKMHATTRDRAGAARQPAAVADRVRPRRVQGHQRSRTGTRPATRR